MEKCKVKGCNRRDIFLIYYGSPVCERCYTRDCDPNDEFSLKTALGIPYEARKLSPSAGGWFP